MSETDTDDTEIEGGGSAAPKKRKLSGRVLVLFAGLPIALIGGGVAAFLLLGGGSEPAAVAAEHGAAAPAAHETQAEAGDQGGGASSGHGPARSSGGHAGGDPGKLTYAGNDLVFYDLPDMIVNLNTDGKQPRYLKIRVALEFGDQAVVPRIEKVMPRIIDHFQVYLRELRREDLQGSAGVYRLKEELMIRVNQAVRPARIRDVLFREMLIQ